MPDDVRFHIHDLTQETDKYPFGIDPPRVAAGLRRLADLIDECKVSVQQIDLSAAMPIDDYVLERLVIEFVQVPLPAVT